MKKILPLFLAVLFIFSSCAVNDYAESEPVGKIIISPNLPKKTETETKEIEEISAIMHDGTNYWPTYAWSRRSLSSLQEPLFKDERYNNVILSFTKLKQYFDYIQEKFDEDIANEVSYDSMFGNFTSVVVAHKGHIVYEKYTDTTKQNENNMNWSLTKSFVSALVGIAIDEGHIKLDDKVLDYFTDYKIENIDDNKKAMTIRDVLTMQSGLKWDDGNSNRSLRNDENPVQKLLSAPMECAPGTQFSYNTSSSSILTAIIQKVTGMTAYEYAKEKLFDPIGIHSAVWGADQQGINFGGMGLDMNAEDLLRFGHLYLHNGIWDGKQILPADWVKESTKTQVDLQTNGSKKAEEFKNTGSYGYHWWTPSGEYDKHVKSDSTSAGSLYNGTDIKEFVKYFRNDTTIKDGDLFRATGYAGQYLYVIPKYDLVVVITGSVGNSPVDIGNYLVFNKILPDIKGYGSYTEFDSFEEFDKYYEEVIKKEFDPDFKYIQSDYLR